MTGERDSVRETVDRLRNPVRVVIDDRSVVDRCALVTEAKIGASIIEDQAETISTLRAEVETLKGAVSSVLNEITEQAKFGYAIISTNAPPEWDDEIWKQGDPHSLAVAQELRAALSQEGKVDVSTPRFCSFCSGSGTFDDDPEVPGSVVECTWCGGTGDAPQEGKAES